METRYQNMSTRLSHGKAREHQIALALQQQAGLSLISASEDEDKEYGVDRWLMRGDQRHSLQIKYREKSESVLFEVYSRFEGIDNPLNRVGRDMRGSAEYYACLLGDRRTVIIFRTVIAKDIISEAKGLISKFGWTVPGIFRWFINGIKTELRVQTDPSSGNNKLLAYFPKSLLETFEGIEKYTILLPEHWKEAT